MISLLLGWESERLGWGPTVEHICAGKETQYKFTIGKQIFTTTRLLAMYGADVIIGRGTWVYKTQDENGDIVAIKDSWQDEDRELEGRSWHKCSMPFGTRCHRVHTSTA